jgi:hypothetical protein
MAWQPDNRQWIVIALTFALVAWAAVQPDTVADLLGYSGLDRTRFTAAARVPYLIAIAGALVVWWLQSTRRQRP